MSDFEDFFLAFLVVVVCCWFMLWSVGEQSKMVSEINMQRVLSGNGCMPSSGQCVNSGMWNVCRMISDNCDKPK